MVTFSYQILVYQLKSIGEGKGSFECRFIRFSKFGPIWLGKESRHNGKFSMILILHTHAYFSYVATF